MCSHVMFLRLQGNSSHHSSTSELLLHVVCLEKSTSHHPAKQGVLWRHRSRAFTHSSRMKRQLSDNHEERTKAKATGSFAARGARVSRSLRFPITSNLSGSPAPSNGFPAATGASPTGECVHAEAA
jgi:hypothetical protein